MVIVVISGLASAATKRAFSKYSKVPNRRGMTGADVASAILSANQIHDVKVEPVQGTLSDHYDPRTKTLRLSEPVYGERSLAAAGVAAHEVGHAIQHATGYAPLRFRSAWVPITLPVEFDASARAVRTLQRQQILAPDEIGGAKSVLNAAALTYVAAAAASILTLLYWAFRLGLIGGRRD